MLPKKKAFLVVERVASTWFDSSLEFLQLGSLLACLKVHLWCKQLWFWILGIFVFCRSIVMSWSIESNTSSFKLGLFCFILANTQSFMCSNLPKLWSSGKTQWFTHDMEIFKKLFFFATFSMVLCLSLVFYPRMKLL